ncbi:hypothetical protein K1719_018407 [Acacia pycnantha]|nr:hypothetical protein K1719_018407 [Acacia pycnantha]
MPMAKSFKALTEGTAPSKLGLAPKLAAAFCFILASNASSTTCLKPYGAIHIERSRRRTRTVEDGGNERSRRKMRTAEDEHGELARLFLLNSRW